MQLNQFYSYLGRKHNIILTKNVNSTELQELLLTRIISKIIEFNNETFVVLMEGNLNFDLLKNINYNIDKLNYKNIESKIKSNVAIASAVTAYGHIEMIKYKTLPGINVYYSDTDSLFIDKPLPNNMVGDDLGKMKN